MAFATILAVISGLVLAASAAIAHDVYVNVIKDGHADQHEQVTAARITSLIVGICGIIIGIAAEKQNVAHLVALAFAVASSGNLPVVVLSLFWRKMNTAGVISGLVVGTIVSVGLLMVSPNMTYPEKVADNAKAAYTKLEKDIADGKIKPEAMEKTQATIEAKKNEEAANRGDLDAWAEGPAVRVEKPWHRLDPDRLPGCYPGRPGVPREARGRYVRRDLCPPEHRHRHGLPSFRISRDNHRRSIQELYSRSRPRPGPDCRSNPVETS